MAEALKKRGMNDPEYLKATLGNVMKESGGKIVNENLNYGSTSNDRIKKIFGKRASSKSDEELNEIKKDPSKMGEMMYGKDTEIGQKMGNTEIGDGFKYRGRGLIQITGKSLYAQCSQALFGDDRLVKNPDLINDPSVATEAAAWYMEKTRGSMAKKMGIDITKKLDKGSAAELATSQIAGRDVNTSGDYLKNELMGKVKNNMGSAAVEQAVAGGSPATASTRGTSPATASTRGTSPAPTPAPTTAANGKVQSSADSLKEAGLLLKKGDVQKEGAELDPRLIEIAKQVQAQVPGFVQFTGFNDQFHYEKAPSSLHAKGKAFDFVINKAPTKEEGKKINDIMKSLGIDYAIDEYNNPSAQATGGHFHGQLNEKKKAYDGGVFEGPRGGYDVELHGREAIVPLPNPDSIIKVEDKKTEKKQLQTVMEDSSSQTTNTMDTGMMMDLIQMLSDKLDNVIGVLEDGNSTSNKILQYSQV